MKMLLLNYSGVKTIASGEFNANNQLFVEIDGQLVELDSCREGLSVTEATFDDINSSNNTDELYGGCLLHALRLL